MARARLALTALLGLSIAGPAPLAARPRKPAPTAPAAQPPPVATPATPPDNRPYDPQLLRLAELLGALTTLRQVCGAGDAEAWRGRMQALIDAEGTPASRKDRLAGAYNRGLQGYGLTYRTCTPNARLVISRFLDESSRLAREIADRYRAG